MQSPDPVVIPQGAEYSSRLSISPSPVPSQELARIIEAILDSGLSASLDQIRIIYRDRDRDSSPHPWRVEPAGADTLAIYSSSDTYSHIEECSVQIPGVSFPNLLRLCVLAQELLNRIAPLP